MPFETPLAPPRRIAVIGAGISGMGAAHLLGERHRVTLFEAEPRLGGHARTKIAGKRGDQPVDTGFIVFNEPNYPHLTALFAKLGVPRCESDMSFAASIRGGWLEYGLNGNGMAGLFAQRRNLARPRFLRMIRDILRFNARAEGVAARDASMTTAELIAALGLGQDFRAHYLEPFSGAIWSTPVDRILDFPARALMDFFRNHALLSYDGAHQWYTVPGGSIEYVRRLEAALRAQGVEIRPGCPVAAVRRTGPGSGVELRPEGGTAETFDEVVFATHSDTALRLLADPSGHERASLGAVGYQANEVVLHCDTSIMPRRAACWSSWNYTEPASGRGDRIGVTYWMNALQPIPKDDPLFVTLNASDRIREEAIHDATVLHHPVYDAAALAAQARIRAANGTNATWFCGAWMANGFHEDGLASAVAVAEGLARRRPEGIAAR